MTDTKRGHKKDHLGSAIDVSQWQGSVDWAKVATAHPVGFAKATEGASYIDPWFSAARVDAMRKNVRAGFYHFARPASNSGTSEALHFLAACHSRGVNFESFHGWKHGGPGQVALLDFETAPFSATYAVEWADTFHSHTGHRPLIYGGGYSLNPIVGVLSHFAAIVFAAYVSDWRPYFTGPHDKVKFWQYTSSGSSPGVSGAVDLSHYIP